LKRYYNFFAESDGLLKTHFMSDQENFEILEFKNFYESFKTNNQSVVANQKKSVSFDQVKTKKVELKSFKSKMVQWRILQKIPTNKINKSELSSGENCSILLNNYEFCNNKCSTCFKNCNFRLSEISTLNSTQVNLELKLHGHPQSRRNKRTKKARTLQEAISELHNHYN